jgi:multiple sugar transport system substrate-binding protein
MWTGSQAEVDNWKALAANVTKKYPNITITFDTISFASYWGKLQLEIASGTTQDILSLQSLRASGYGSGFLPLDSYITNDPTINISDFSNAILPNLTYDGHQIALPYDFGPYIVFYNKDLFDKYNVPYPQVGWTMQDFLNDLKALSHGDDYGFVFSSWIDQWLPFVLSNGGTYLDQNGKFDLTNPKTVQAIQTIADLIKNHEAMPMVSTTDINWHMEQWLAGHVAMHINGPWQIINFSKKANFKFGIATNPVGSAGSVTVTAGSGFGVSKATKYPEQAFKAVEVLTSPDSEKILALAGRAFPARVSQETSYFQAQGVEPSFQPILAYGVSHSVPYRITTTWAQANNIIFTSLIPIFNGEVPVQQGLSDLQQRLNSLQ